MRRSGLLALGIANFFAIAAWMIWGIAGHEWSLEMIGGGNPHPHEIVRWLLIVLNAPAFLLAVSAIAPLRLTLLQEYAATSVLWAFATIPMWVAYSNLIRPMDRMARLTFAPVGVASLIAAAWAFTIAWREGHDPHHSCWSVLALVSMMFGISLVAAVPIVMNSGRGVEV
ncbi:MAG: hypothetical protein ACXVH7_05230 [Thermoanaerobaculia bacterium]